jgi:hypothetical protein
MQYKQAQAHAHAHQPITVPHSKYFKRHTVRVAVIVVFAFLTVLLSVSLSIFLQQM